MLHSERNDHSPNLAKLALAQTRNNLTLSFCLKALERVANGPLMFYRPCCSLSCLDLLGDIPQTRDYCELCSKPSVTLLKMMLQDESL